MANDQADAPIGPKPLADRIEIVVVTYNSEAMIVDCLASIAPGITTWVIDNASTDGSPSLAMASEAKTRVLARNLGYGRANNVALREIDSDYVLLLNPDARLLPGSLERLIAIADDNPDFALLSPTLLDRPPAEGPTPSDGAGVVERREIIGAVMLMRMAVFRQIGFFDEHIFMYGEDNELCQRTWLSGYRCGEVPSIVAVHFGNKSTPYSDRAQFRKWMVSGRSFTYIVRKHNSRAEYTIFVVRKFFLYLFGTISACLRFDKPMVLRNGGRFIGLCQFLFTGRTA